jgi:uncharacterized protein YndB with AHSA1/START domain
MAQNLVAVATVIVHAPTNKVWNALVDPLAIKKYMFGVEVVSDWREGSQIIWKGEWQGKPFEDKGKILEYRPGRMLQYSHFSPLSGLADKPENYHTVTIDLLPEDGQTRVTLVQDNNGSAEERDESKKNWEAMLSELKEFLEK